VRDHTPDMTPEEREANRRMLTDITDAMRSDGPKIITTPQRAAKRSRRKQAKESRRRNR
jgi:hypothetical protein